MKILLIDAYRGAVHRVKNTWLRYLVPISFVLAAKVLAGLFLYHQLNLGYRDLFWMSGDTAPLWSQNEVFWLPVDQSFRWLYLFLGWDSAWYLSIMTRGYAFSSQSYAFFPGLPLFGGLFNLVIKNPVLSMWLCSSAFGLLWIPVYQLIMEKYVSKQGAMASVLFFAFSPYVFLFTTMVYAEGLFLFFTLLAWHNYQEKNFNAAILFASISTLARPVGFLIVIPMILGVLNDDEGTKFIRVLKNTLPLGALFGCFSYIRLASGDWLAPLHTSEWDTMYTFGTWVTEIIPENGTGALSFPIPWLEQHPVAPFFILFFTIMPLFLIYSLIKKRDVLGYYSLVYYGLIVYVGAMLSYPRFLSFLFPVWMLGSSVAIKKIQFPLLVLVILTFYLTSLSLWGGFISGVFIA